jgi:HK97 family phage prohead protease
MTIRRLERPFEIKAGSVRDDGSFAGYGAIFNTKDSYRDIIMPGAFAKTLEDDFAAKSRKVPILWQHDRRNPIGVYDVVKEDTTGLYVEGRINMEVQQGKEAHALMKQGALTGLSIGYGTVMDKWDEAELVRELHEVKLWEISPVTFPAHDDSRINSVKSIEGLATLSDVEEYLRDAGNFSRKETLALIARIKSASVPRDAGAEQAALATLQNTLRSLKSI